MIHYFFNSLHFLLILISILGCTNKEEEEGKNHIDYLKAYDIPVIEPSGLALTSEERGFWTVSDNNSTIYLLDNWGQIQSSIVVNGIDLEGIAVVNETTIAVVLERGREITVLDTSGIELQRIKVALTGELNHGLEGITYDSENKKYYVLNEKNPCLLLSFDEHLNELSRDTLNFIKDASGIHYDPGNKLLWLLSDESRCVTKCDLKGNPIKKYLIEVAQPEGLSIDSAGKKMYIVSDINNALYVFSLE